MQKIDAEKYTRPELRAWAERLLNRLEQLGMTEDVDRFDAYLEEVWDDSASLADAIDDMRDLLFDERKNR